MKKFTKKVITIASILMAGSLLIAGCGTTETKKGKMTDAKMESPMKEEKTPKYVFYFIGDGMGTSQRQLAEYYAQHFLENDSYKLKMNTLKVAGINTTHSSNTLVTDSAAAGTALATGYKTDNGVIAMTPEGKSVKTLVEAAEEKGMKTALISTTRLTHATPASFASHNISRNNENEIAADFVDSGVDFYAGGGFRHFVAKDNAEGLKSKRKDDKNLVAEFEAEGYKTFIGEDDSKEFMNYTPSKDDKIFAALTYSHMPYEVDRAQTENVPSLAELTEKGIETLESSDTGFFMMVEAGRIDHAGHANDAMGNIGDTLAFDEAIKVAYDFYMEHPEETLIVVTADHETGGMGMGFAKNYWLNMGALDQTTMSVEDKLQKSYKGDREAFLKLLADEFGLFNLSEAEVERINEGMDMADAGQKIAGYYNPAAIAATHVLSEKANLEWTTYAHTGTQIALSAEGVLAEKFGGYKDNTEVAKAMFEVIEAR